MKTIRIVMPKIEVEALLAVGAFLLFAAIAIGVLNFVVPPQNEKYAMLMLGALIGIVKDTFGRYFQATKGAQEQRQDSADVAKKLAETAAVVAANAAAAPPPPAPGTANVQAAPDVEVSVTAPSSPAQGPGGA